MTSTTSAAAGTATDRHRDAGRPRTGKAGADGLTLDAGLREAVTLRVAADPDLGRHPRDRAHLRRAVARALAAEGVVVAPARWAALVRALVDELGGLGPLEALLRDPAVTDVMVNAPDEVWVDREGRVERAGVAFQSDDHVEAILGRVLGPAGVRLDPAHPWADAVLDGGIRLHAVLPPLAPRPTVTLRRMPSVVPSWEELAASGSVPPDARSVLQGLVTDRRNIVVSGRAGVGKTTLLARLLEDVGNDRVVIIEDTPELAPACRHRVHLRVRPATPDGGRGVDVATLVRNALRMRPDRIVVGEVRGAEVADMLQAMNTGHAGSLTTVHANSAEDALVRLQGMALLAGVPEAASRAQVATAVEAIVALDRDGDGRRHIGEIVTVSSGPSGPTTRRLWP